VGTLYTGYQIDRFRLLVLRSALKLEIKGMKKRGKSAYSTIKQEFNLKGNKQRVLDQLNDIITEAMR
tara:strand:+ start:192 stop:392 length:201 start_codon:yes stop_codon:yes gene_type:complete